MVTQEQIDAFKAKVDLWVRTKTQMHTVTRANTSALWDELADFFSQVSRPDSFDVFWEDMESEGGDDGEIRYTYINPILTGFNPSAHTGTTLLYRAKEYDMFAGGIFRLNEGFGIYAGQSIRFESFRTYIAPPLPVPTVGTVLIDNQSSVSVSYNDNFTGTASLPSGEQFYKDPIVDGQTLHIDFTNGITTYYTAYNADGSVFNEIVFVSPPSTGFTNANMDINKSYVYIVTDTGTPPIPGFWNDDESWNDEGIWEDGE